LEYVVARDLEHAVALKAAGHTVLAGGTDHYPVRVGRPLTEPIVDIAALDDLRGIAHVDGHFRFGGLTRWADVVVADLGRGFDGLRAAAREIGGPQVQHAGTVAGNLCTASPAADGVTAFLALEASVECTGRDGVRVLPLGEFVTGYRETALAPDELVTAVLVPEAVAEAGSAFVKLGLRRYLVISIAMAAAVLTIDADGRIAVARVAVGACSPVARRLEELEAELIGRTAADLPEVTEAHAAALTPIDDVRGSAGYRRHAARELAARAIADAVRAAS
jgi:CO/xanthine dehydrogenase FAD-binding subunit